MENQQSIIQKKIALANNENAGMIIELIRDCMPKKPLIADDEFNTLVNAVTLDTYTDLMIRMVDYLQEIRSGQLHDQQK